MIKVRSLLLLYQIFEYADIFRLLNFDSENLLQVVTENKAVEREKLCGIENRNRLSHFQKGLDAVPRRRLAQRTGCLCNDMKVIIIHDIEKG